MKFLLDNFIELLFLAIIILIIMLWLSTLRGRDAMPWLNAQSARPSSGREAPRPIFLRHVLNSRRHQSIFSHVLCDFLKKFNPCILCLAPGDLRHRPLYVVVPHIQLNQLLFNFSRFST